MHRTAHHFTDTRAHKHIAFSFFSFFFLLPLSRSRSPYFFKNVLPLPSFPLFLPLYLPPVPRSFRRGSAFRAPWHWAAPSSPCSRNRLTHVALLPPPGQHRCAAASVVAGVPPSSTHLPLPPTLPLPAGREGALDFRPCLSRGK